VDVPAEHGDLWGLDQEIEQTAHMAQAWERQAAAAEGTVSVELIRSIALGYRLQLNALLETRASEPVSDCVERRPNADMSEKLSR
jgi:hypothetical protein